MLLRAGRGPFVQLLEDFDAWDPDAIPFGSRPLDYLMTLAKSHRAMVIHGNYLDDDEIGFLAAHAENMAVVYCPRTHAYFQHDPYPLGKMIAAGANVAIGTDSRASNPDLSVLADMRFAATQHPFDSAGDAAANDHRQCRESAGRDDEIGTITPGKLADLAIMQLPRHDAAEPHELLFDPDCRILATIFRGRQVYGDSLAFTSRAPLSYSRQFVISVSKIAEAPSASSRSMMPITSPRRTITCTAHQAGSSERIDGRRIEAGRDFFGLRQFAARHVVFQQRITAGNHHAFQPPHDAIGQFGMPRALF